MTGRLEGKVAFITGGGSGIGEATAHRFTEEGATVVICGRRKELLDGVVAAIRARGGRAEAVQVDVGNEEQYVAALDDAAKRHGRLDILVNNAMAYSVGPIERTSTNDWHGNFSTTVDGTFWGTRAALRLMRKQGKGGAIVNVSSIAAIRWTGYPYAAYYAAKAAVNNFTMGLALQYAKDGIRANAIMPGLMNTPMAVDTRAREFSKTRAEVEAERDSKVPLRRKMGTGWDVANAALFLASDEANFITGVTLPVDGGASVRRG